MRAQETVREHIVSIRARDQLGITSKSWHNVVGSRVKLDVPVAQDDGPFDESHNSLAAIAMKGIRIFWSYWPYSCSPIRNADAPLKYALTEEASADVVAPASIDLYAHARRGT